MAKKYKQKSLFDVPVKAHKRHDPRIDKKVDVKGYKRTQEVKPYKKTTDTIKELYAKTSDREKATIKMKYLTNEVQDVIDLLDAGEISENSKDLESVLKNASPQDRKIIDEEIQKTKLLNAFGELITEKGMKNPSMLKELLSLDEIGLAWFNKEDQERIKLIQKFYIEEKEKEKSKSKYYDHNEYQRAVNTVIDLRAYIKEDTKDRDRAMEIGESKERIKYLDKKLGEKHILLLKAIEKRNRINKLPRGSMADKIAKNKEDKEGYKLPQNKYLYGGIQANIDEQVTKIRSKLIKAKNEGRINWGDKWELVRVNKKTVTIKDKSGTIIKNDIQFITEDVVKQLRKPKEIKRFDELPEDMNKEDLKEYKRIQHKTQMKYMRSDAGFEDNNEGKHAIWRGKETKAFIEWKKKFEDKL